MPFRCLGRRLSFVVIITIYLLFILACFLPHVVGSDAIPIWSQVRARDHICSPPVHPYHFLDRPAICLRITCLGVGLGVQQHNVMARSRSAGLISLEKVAVIETVVWMSMCLSDGLIVPSTPERNRDLLRLSLPAKPPSEPGKPRPPSECSAWAGSAPELPTVYSRAGSTLGKAI